MPLTISAPSSTAALGLLPRACRIAGERNDQADLDILLSRSLSGRERQHEGCCSNQFPQSFLPLQRYSVRPEYRSFDHGVSEGEYGLRHLKTQCFGRPEIDDQL